MTKLDERLRLADEIPIEDRWEEIRARQPAQSQSAHGANPRRWITIVVALAIGAFAIAAVAVAFRGTSSRRPGKQGTPQSPPPALEARVAGRVDVGATAGSVGATDGQVWVATYDFHSGSAAIVHVDASTGQVVATIPIDGLADNIAAGNGLAWAVVADPHGGASLVRIDGRTDRISGTVPGVSGPVAVDTSGVWSAEGNDVVRIDPESLAIEARVPVGGSTFDIAAGGGAVWVLESEANGDNVKTFSLIQIDAATATVSQRVDLSISGIWIAADQDGVWVNGWRPDDPDAGGAFFVPSSGGPAQDAARIPNFRPFAVAEGHAWFISGPQESGLPEGGICGLNVSTHVVNTCASPLSMADLELAHDPAAYDPVTRTLWAGEYESSFVTKIELVPASS
jgi:hypothetical protein